MWGLTLVLTIVLVLAGACDRSESTEEPGPAAPTPTVAAVESSGQQVTDAAPGSVGLGDPVFPLHGNGGYDVTRYTLDLTPDFEADFIALAEEVAGQSLAVLFDAWLYTEAVPDLGPLGLSPQR